MSDTLNWTFDRYVRTVPEGMDCLADEARYKTILNGRIAYLFLCDESDTAVVHMPCGGFLCPKQIRKFPKKDTLKENFETASVLIRDIINGQNQ